MADVCGIGRLHSPRTTPLIIFACNLPVTRFGLPVTSRHSYLRLKLKRSSSRKKIFIKVLAVHLSVCERSIRPKSSRRPEGSLRRFRLRWIFTEKTPRLRFVARPSNRRQLLKRKSVLWPPISPLRSVTTNHHPILRL